MRLRIITAGLTGAALAVLLTGCPSISGDGPDGPYGAPMGSQPPAVSAEAAAGG